MNHKHLFAMIVAGIGLASQGAFASDGNITFVGKITDTTCQINGNGTGNKDFTVTLPTVQAPALGTAKRGVSVSKAISTPMRQPPSSTTRSATTAE